MATITVGENSWVTRAEADSYLDEKFGSENWGLASTDNRSRAIITAFWKIYGSSHYSISKVETDEKVKNAQIETAFFILENNQSLKNRKALQAAGVKRFGISKFSESYDLSKNSFLPPEAEELLYDWQAYDPIVTYSRELD